MVGHWSKPPPPRRLHGEEVLAGTDATVADFWRWAFSDLRTNNLRGVLAEYLVACALGAAGGTRVEWDGHDVTTREGVRVEVKASAYLQVWAQARPSRIVFTGLAARTWSPQEGYTADASNNADVYVFAIQTSQDHDQYDVLDVGQWEFHVLPAETLRRLGVRSLSYPTLRRYAAGPVSWSDLASTVAEVTAPKNTLPPLIVPRGSPGGSSGAGRTF